MKTEVFNLTNKDVTLTTYILDDSKEMPNWNRRPAMLVIPGGGYAFCSDREAEPIAMAFAAKGWNTFVLRYSIGKGNALFPRPLNDAEEAMDMIIKNAEEWHIDTERIAAIGFSAGGHLTAALSTMGRVRPNAAVLCYPCILDTMSTILADPIQGVDTEVDDKTPPTFIVSSREDGCVPIENSLRYADALEKAGIDFEMHIYSKGYHGFSLANDVVYSKKESFEYNRHMEGWFDLCITWFKKTWGENV